jgi:hypothetical protein
MARNRIWQTTKMHSVPKASATSGTWQVQYLASITGVGFCRNIDSVLTARSKSCKLAFRAIDPTVFPGELEDLAEYGLNDEYRDHRLASFLKKDATSRSSTAGSPASASSADGLGKARQANPDHDPKIELVCRRMVIKWEPFFNIVHRYMWCRCILRKTSPASCEKEMTFLVTPFQAVCPRHNSQGITFWDYGNDDYHDDPYFDRFGGYDMFRFLALGCSKDSFDTAVGGEKFMSDEDFRREQQKYLGLSEERQASLRSVMMEDYFIEGWDTLDRSNLPLPPHAAEKVRERRERGNDKRRAWKGNYSDSETRQALYDSPMMREVRQICAGTSNGKPHWTPEL